MTHRTIIFASSGLALGIDPSWWVACSCGWESHTIPTDGTPRSGFLSRAAAERAEAHHQTT